jgi:hypothetical protein
MKLYTSHSKTIRAALLIGAVASLLSVSAAWAAVVIPDTVTVATVNGAQFSTIDVPVYIRDASGTPIGLDQPPGSRIQSYSIKVNYSPASAVQSISFTRAGITQALTPTFENSPSSAGTISLLDTFNEATDLIPFTLDGALPGNQVAHLLVTLTPATTPGTVITLTIDPSSTLTQLTDQAGSPATAENTGNARLVLVNGAITVVPAIPALGHLALLLLAIALGVIAIRFRS